MNAKISRLHQLREAVVISQRELARSIGQQQSNVQFRERSGVLPRGEMILPTAKALSVSAEVLLGEVDKPKRIVAKGRLQKIFEAASKLPRRQQEKVANVLEAFVSQQSNKAA